MIIARNYLDVYPYDKWNAKEIHIYEEGQTFSPNIEMAGGETGPPELLTEADLIALMDKHGIGKSFSVRNASCGFIQGRRQGGAGRKMPP